ncbi:MAG: hypothetical protein JWO90_1741 [Solirubrobacterales bacterium]|nr:hypothetical protein [Solirubrobacterales bacterium]
MTACLACVAVASAAGPAFAADSIAPPGQSAIDQYQETVPGAGGSTSGGGTPSSGDPAVAAKAKRAIPAPALKALSKTADGRAAAALAASGAPVDADAPKDSARPSSAAPVTPDDRVSDDGFVKVIADSVGGSGGNGISPALPLVLLGVTFLGGVVVLLRRRGGGAPA